MTITDHNNTPTRERRFGRLIERDDGRDFPFYDGDPLALSTWKWLVIVASCIVAFVVLSLIPEPNDFVALLPRLLFVLIPLGTFVAFTRGRWTALFRRLRWADLGTIVIYWLITDSLSAILAIIGRTLFGADDSPNGATSGVASSGAGGIAVFYGGTAIQIFGEEVFTILPFLAVMYFMYSKFGTSRRTAIIVAWLITAVWFGAAHLPTYDWHVYQALAVIGGGRLILSLAFIRTKNILVSTGTHILDDFSLFTFSIIFS
jgi:uncharacterized protein